MEFQIKDYDISNDYILDQKMGQGNFASVYRGFHKTEKRQVAIKVISKKGMDFDQQLALQNEILLMNQINHPSIVKLLDAYNTQHHCYIVLEMMSGGELFDRIIEKESYSEKDACEVIVPVIDAIRCCHKLGIAHRDLKPENLLYSEEGPGGIIKVSDFGVSKMINDGLTHTAIGTPSYIAPEVIAGKGYSLQIDYWAVGVILYILLCGYPPFSEDSNQKLFQLIKNARYEFPEEDWGRISDEAKDLIRHLLVVDPQKRFGAEQIMEHEWIKSQKKDQHLLVQVPQKIHNYNARRRFKKASLTVYASKVICKTILKK